MTVADPYEAGFDDITVHVARIDIQKCSGISVDISLVIIF